MLYSDFLNNVGYGIHKWNQYFPVYERYLSPFINRSLVMFEIGVDNGGSIHMWKRFLGPFATVVGIDIDESCRQYEDPLCHVRIGDQKDPEFLAGLVKEFGTPDIVIDDGSHKMEDMTATFDFLYPLLNNNGVYIVEDTHTCYSAAWGGGLRSPDSFIEKTKSLVDEMHSGYVRDNKRWSDFTNSTFSIAFFDSMVVFEKKIHERAFSMASGNYTPK